MSEHDNDFREVIDEENKDADVVEVTGDTTVDPSVADPNNDKKDDYEDICYICRRPESVAGKMIHIPNNICICNDCMQKTFDSMEGFGFGSGDNASLNNIDFSKMPNISMVNLSDLSDFMPNMPNSQRLKKKKKKEDKQKGSAPSLAAENAEASAAEPLQSDEMRKRDEFHIDEELEELERLKAAVERKAEEELRRIEQMEKNVIH